MRPVVVPSEKSSEFAALIKEYSELTKSVSKMAEEIVEHGYEPIKFEEMVRRQDGMIEIIDTIREWASD